MDKDQLKVFYSRIFPFELLSKWVAYGDAAYYARREFACELDVQGAAVFKRHMSFATAEEMRREFCALVPMRIEVGPVYNHSPRQRDAHPDFATVERELIFDVDMNDYDEVRTCCKGTAVCARCWPLATTALKVMELVLREAFGFRSMLWVFSGRRGVHCWVADRRARRLSLDAREAIVAFMTVVVGGQGALASRVPLRFPLHPVLQRVYDSLLLPFFERRFLVEQGVLEDAGLRAAVLGFFPEELRKEIAAAWEE
jgi:DNA primase small subunit